MRGIIDYSGEKSFVFVQCVSLKTLNFVFFYISYEND